MKRLFQFGTILMLIGAVYPLLELFDRWDKPGFSNDTEFAVYALLFAICFVLLLSKLIASGLLNFIFATWRLLLHEAKVGLVETGHASIFAVPPLLVVPLRI